MDIDGNNYCPRCMRKLAETDTDVSACPLCGREPGTRRPPMALDSGTLLAGRYQLGDVIGQGGFGITYAAWDETLGMPVAVKEFFPREDAARDTEISDGLAPLPEREAVFADGLSRFRRESNLLASLQGIPCVVKVMDFFSENETAYIVMEFVHGTPIDRWVRENDIKPTELLEKLRPVVDALVRTHSQGVIHRDITPDNILVEEDGSLKLIDFGSAVEVERSEGTVLLTRRYAPVEQYGRDYGRQGPWTDVYSLAAVMYTLFSGQEPVEAPLRVHHDEQEPLSRMRTGLKGREAAAINRALIVDPEKRTQSMAEFRAALYHLPMPEEVLRRKRFTRRVVAVAAVLLLLLGLVTLNFTTGLPVGSSLLGSLRSNGIYIVRHLRKQEEVTVPESVLGIPVSKINSDAFRGDGTLRRIDIPGSVKSVGASAFYDCDKLEEASLAEGVETIGYLAFGACNSLQTLTLPDTLTEIGESALPEQAEQMTVWGSRGTETERYSDEHELRFADASELTWEIHDGAAEITSIQSEAKRLTLPNMVDGVPVIAIRDGIQLLTQEEVWLPENLAVVTPELFHGNLKLVHVRIGCHVREIGDSAFNTCIALEKLALPDSLERIGDYAFSSCVVLKELALPDSLERIGRYSFTRTKFKELTLPEGLREIGDNAFESSTINNLYIPDSVQTIGEDAFRSTRQLEKIKLPKYLQELPAGAFTNSDLKTVILPESMTGIGNWTFYESGLQWIALPDGIREIPSNTFYSCRDLHFILIPASVEIIQDYSFKNWPADMVIAGYAGSAAEEYALRKGITFEDISLWTMPDEWQADGKVVYGADRTEQIIHVPLYNERDNILVTDCVCSDNPYVEELILSPYQTEIGQEAFKGNTSLRHLRAKGEILRVGRRAFSGCSSLETIPLENAKIIGKEAFKSCSSLPSAFLDNVELIDEEAFYDCSSLRELRLANRLTNIEYHAFTSCNNLQYVVLPGHLVDLSSDAFGVCHSLQLVVFKEGAVTPVEPPLQFSGCTSLREIWCSSKIRQFDMRSVTSVLSLDRAYPEVRDIWLYNPETKIIMADPYDKQPAWTMHGYAGSTAEQWAKENGVRFEPIPDGTVMPDPWEIVEAFDFDEIREGTEKQ